MQLHKWLESPIFARQKICEICAWSLAAWILDFAFAQSVVFFKRKNFLESRMIKLDLGKQDDKIM